MKSSYLSETELKKNLKKHLLKEADLLEQTLKGKKNTTHLVTHG